MNSFRTSPFANTPSVVKNLLIINIIFFIATLLFEKGGNSPLIEWLSIYYFDSPHFRIWQVITYMFMHGSFAHIFFNMFALFTFGTAIEYIMGSKRFLNFYLICGIGALALQFLVQAIEVYNIAGSVTIGSATSIQVTDHQMSIIRDIYSSPMLGASGAIFGLLIAFVMLFPDAELYIMFIPIPVKAKYIIPVYVLVELFSGVAQFSGDNIAHFAHLGGALFGFILIKMWGIKRPGGYL